jgi:hypothetical protein
MNCRALASLRNDIKITYDTVSEKGEEKFVRRNELRAKRKLKLVDFS